MLVSRAYVGAAIKSAFRPKPTDEEQQGLEAFILEMGATHRILDEMIELAKVFHEAELDRTTQSPLAAVMRSRDRLLFDRLMIACTGLPHPAQ